MHPLGGDISTGVGGYSGVEKLHVLDQALVPDVLEAYTL